MTKDFLSQCKKQSAFTLVELMLVLAIISILFSIAIPSYQTFTQKSQRTEGQVLLLEMQTYLERYYFNNQHYPESLSKLRAYQTDKVDSENLYYQVSLKADHSCSPENCYILIAKHTSGEEKETLSLYSSGEKKGPW
jgi:type IV pilus assembly protein PilE